MDELANVRVQVQGTLTTQFLALNDELYTDEGVGTLCVWLEGRAQSQADKLENDGQQESHVTIPSSVVNATLLTSVKYHVLV